MIADPTQDRLVDSPKRPEDAFFDGIIERIGQHHDLYRGADSSPQYYAEVYEFGTRSDDQDDYRRKARPYKNWEQLMHNQFLAHLLKNDSVTCKGILEDFVSYTIGKGIKYDVKPREAYVDDTETIRQVIESQEEINLYLSDNKWLSVQVEALRDRLLCGDLFRQYDEVDGRLDFAFIDSHEVCPPKRDSADVNAPFGIDYSGGDVRKPSRYYVNDGWVGADKMQHEKFNADSRDPRGWGALTVGFCDAKEADELNYAATQSGLAYSRNTIVSEFPEDYEGSLADIAKNVTQNELNAFGRGLYNAGGGERMARGYTVSGLAAQWASDGFTSLIDFKTRLVGRLLSEPEFVSTGKGDTTGRNTAISSEAPLTRRVERVSEVITGLDIDLLYQVLAVFFRRFGDKDWMKDFKRRIKIVPRPQTPDGRDRIAKERLILDQLDADVKDPIAAIRESGGEPDDVIEGKIKWALLVRKMEERLQGEVSLNQERTPEEVALRVDTAIKLIGLNIQPQEAMVRAGLDPIEDMTLIDGARQHAEEARLAQAEAAQQASQQTTPDQSNAQNPANAGNATNADPNPGIQEGLSRAGRLKEVVEPADAFQVWLDATYQRFAPTVREEVEAEMLSKVMADPIEYIGRYAVLRGLVAASPIEIPENFYELAAESVNFDERGMPTREALVEAFGDPEFETWYDDVAEAALLSFVNEEIEHRANQMAVDFFDSPEFKLRVMIEQAKFFATLDFQELLRSLSNAEPAGTSSETEDDD